MKIKRRKAEEQVVHLDESVTEQNSAENSERGSDNHDREGKFKVVPADLAVAETARFEHRDLFTLQRDLPAHHRGRHERGHAQKHERESDRETFQHANFVVDAHVRGMVRQTIRTTTAVRSEHAIYRGDHTTFGSAR